MRHAVLGIALLTLFSGCTSGRSADQVSLAAKEGQAAPGPDLVGTWRGTVFAVPGSLYLVSTPVDLQIRPDGTWSWSSKGQERGRGRVTIRGDRVILEEDFARKGTTDTTNAAAETIDLQRRGDELWGLTRAFIPGGTNAVDLKKVP